MATLAKLEYKYKNYRKTREPNIFNIEAGTEKIQGTFKKILKLSTNYLTYMFKIILLAICNI